MLEARRRPKGRLLFLLGLLAVARLAVAATPATTTISEGLFGNRSGAEKKDAAISFVSAALSLTEAVANRQIVDEAKFKEGLSMVINGTVECLNASVWAKAEPTEK
jgi:hypothetical protein